MASWAKGNNMIKERLYNIIARNDKTGLNVVCTAYPDSHKHCMTIISKMTKHNFRTVFIEEFKGE